MKYKAVKNTIVKKNLLILGGSGEGFALDKALAGHPVITATTSFAGRTSVPRKPLGPYRTGGFGGAEGLASYIKAHHFGAIIDATHPFASQISRNAAIAAQATSTPLVHIIRPPWRRQPGDNWIMVPTSQAAAAALIPDHSPTLLTIGRLELDAFATRTDLRLFARAIEPVNNDPATEPYPDNVSFIYAKGPFTFEDEFQLVTKHAIRAIVTKNSGGDQASAKLAVARKLALPVIMIDRPKPPEGQIVASLEDALSWLEKTLDTEIAAT